jgi:hypothetical protein
MSVSTRSQADERKDAIATGYRNLSIHSSCPSLFSQIEPSAIGSQANYYLRL